MYISECHFYVVSTFMKVHVICKNSILTKYSSCCFLFYTFLGVQFPGICMHFRYYYIRCAILDIHITMASIQHCYYGNYRYRFPEVYKVGITIQMTQSPCVFWHALVHHGQFPSFSSSGRLSLQSN